MAMKMTDEARNKFKTIIQTKLVELVGHCEAELPDYIVSMIVNSQVKEYLVRSLEVFIGGKAEAFSDWLLELQSKIGAAQEPVAEVKHEEINMDFDEEAVNTKPKEMESGSRKRRSIDNDDDYRKSRSDRQDRRLDSGPSSTSDRPASKVSRREQPRKSDEDRKRVASVVHASSPAQRTLASGVTVMRKVATDSSVETDSTIRRRLASGTTVRVRLDKPPQANGEAQNTTQKTRIVWDLGKDEEAKKVEAESGSRHDHNETAVVDARFTAVKVERAIKTKGDVSFEEGIDNYMEEEWSDKSKTRCTFWPKCARGDECAFAHPTIACRNFPRCVYGKYCLYVHPMCKFGDACFNAECSAIHGDADAVATVSKLLGTEPSDAPSSAEKQSGDGALIEPTTGTSIACRYGSRCLNPGCSFVHPPECRYGDDCFSTVCAFRHPNTRYQWKAFC